MQSMRFSAIAADIERKIRDGVFVGKLPTTLELAHLYACGKCTVTNALRPLEQAGLLRLESRRGGLAIDRTKLRFGMIGVVGSWSFDHDIDDLQTLAPTVARMRQDGFEPVTMRYNSELDNARAIQLFNRSFDGLIFTNSSLNEELSLALEAQKLPFISCNQLRFHRRLNFIGFRLFDQLPQVVDRLIGHGYRQIAFFCPGRVEGFNDETRRKWIQLKMSRQLPLLVCDRLLLNWRDSRLEQTRRFADFCLRNAVVPDALIFWSGAEPEYLELFHEKGFRFPNPTLLIHIAKPELARHPEHIAIATIKGEDLFHHAYQALRELIYAPSNKVLKRFIACPSEIQGEIPVRS